MVKWIYNISRSLQRLGNAWMHNLPMSALREEQRRIQYLAIVTKENDEITTRGETASDPNTPPNRERWNTAPVSEHEGFFSHSDKIITLM